MNAESERRFKTIEASPHLVARNKSVARSNNDKNNTGTREAEPIATADSNRDRLSVNTDDSFSGITVRCIQAAVRR